MLGVILAGGSGSRMNPATLTNNKHLLPVYSEEGAVPMLEYPIRTLKNSGVTDILIITSREHCGKIVEYFGDGSDFGIKLHFRIQEMNRPVTGIAQALALSEHFVGDSPFAVVLGDNYYEENFKATFEEFERLLTEEYQSKAPIANVFLKEVGDPERFGVATIDGIQCDGMKTNASVTKITEKPKVPESNYAVTGLYLYSPHVFSLIPKLKPSRRMELEVTDINQWYVDNNTMTATVLNSFWSDMGTTESMINTMEYIAEKTKCQ